MEIKAVAMKFSVGFRKARYNGTGGVPEDITSNVNFSIDNKKLTVVDNVVGYRFSFAGIVASGGSSVSTDLITNLPADVAKITLVFMPAGGGCSAGGPPPSPIVFTDAFNMDIANFSDCDEFVQVYDVADGNFNSVLSKTANEDGMVATTNPESMHADNQVTDSHGTPKFDSWRIMGGAKSTVPNLNLAADDSYIAIAFFRSPWGTKCHSGIQIMHCHSGIPIMHCLSGIQTIMPCHGGIQTPVIPCHGGAAVCYGGVAYNIPGCGFGPNVPGWQPQGDPAEKRKEKVTPKPTVQRAPKKK